MLEPFVPLDWLVAHRDDAGLVVADVRWSLAGPPGREGFEIGHVPGAVFVDLDTQLAGPASTEAGRHPLPAPADFAAAMSSLGIGDGSVVVAYDDSGGSSASRLVWMLRVLGRQAALLDGGLRAWTERFGVQALETGAVEATPSGFTARPWPADRLVDADRTQQLAASGAAVVLDARDHGRFTGERPAPVDARAGHVPGALSAPWQANLGDDGLVRSADELRQYYSALGIDASASDEPAVLYCGSGVTASLDLLALERAGIDDARLYAGSWSQWAPDPRRPVETGDPEPR